MPGLVQSSFRAEILGVLCAFRFAAHVGKPVRIWTDCAGVVRRVLDLASGSLPRPSQPNADLWGRIYDLISKLQQPWQIFKVTSHTSPDDTEDFVQDWVVMNNADVDAGARQANQSRNQEFWDLWEALRRDYSLQLLRGRAVLELHRRVARKAVQFEGAGQPRLLPTLAAGHPGQLPPLPVGPIPSRLSRYGPSFILSLHAWILSLLQGDHGEASWLSFAQLYVAFHMMQGVLPPIYSAGRKQWIAAVPSDALFQSTTFAQRTIWFRQMVRALFSALRGGLTVAETRPFSPSLAVKLPCAWIPLPSAVYDRVEMWFSENLPSGVCSRNQRSWTRVQYPGMV